jgi:hypothetical protein
MPPAATSKPAKPNRRARRARIALATAFVLALLLADQLGVRRVSGGDFPRVDPDAPKLVALVDALAAPALGGRVPGSRGGIDAAHLLEDALAKAGIGPLPSASGYQVPLVTRSELGPNVIGYLPATAPDARGVIVLGAHYDHLGKTRDGVVLGADDNASSVAVVLEAARALVAEPRKSAVVVAFFNTEEAPYFGTSAQGSRSFVARPPREVASLGEVRVAVVLDLIGGVVWRQNADAIFACGAEKTEGLGAIVDAVQEPSLTVRRLGVHMIEEIPGYGHAPVSDYDVFRQRSVPFLFLSSGRTPRYHTPADLPQTLHFDRMARTSRWITKLVRAVDASEAPLTFDAASEALDVDRATMLSSISAAIRPWSTLPGTSPMSYVRLLQDRLRLGALTSPSTAADKVSLERASFRLQCLLYSYPICFTL